MATTTAHALIVVAAHMPCFATAFSAATVGPSRSRSLCVTIGVATLVSSLVPSHGGPISTPIPVPSVVVASLVPSFPSANCRAEEPELSTMLNRPHDKQFLRTGQCTQLRRDTACARLPKIHRTASRNFCITRLLTAQ